MSETRTYAYKGWFGCCPVFIDQPDSDCPDVIERSRLFVPLFFLSCAVFWLINAVASLIVPGSGPGFWLSVTGRLRKPVTFEIKYSEVTSV